MAGRWWACAAAQGAAIRAPAAFWGLYPPFDRFYSIWGYSLPALFGFIRFCPILFDLIWVYLSLFGLFESIWVYLGLFEFIWFHLGLSELIWVYLGFFEFRGVAG